MPSNKDLKTEIEALCAERSAPVPDLTNLNNPKLVELLDSLKSQDQPEQPLARPLVAPSPSLDADPEPPPIEPEASPPAAGPAAAPAAPAVTIMLNGVDQTRYFVAEGKVVQGRGDPKGAFEQITARDLAGGQEELEAFVASGFVVKR